MAPSPQDAGGKDGLDRYLALCLGGLQSIVKVEVENHITAHRPWRVDIEVFREDCQGVDAHTLKEGVHPGQAGCGKLLVATDAPPDVLKGIRSIQGLFALVAHATSLDIVLPAIKMASPVPTSPEVTKIASSPSRDASGKLLTLKPSDAEGNNPAVVAIACIEALVRESPMWSGALQVWERFTEFEDGGSPSSSTPVEGRLQDASTSICNGSPNTDQDKAHGTTESGGKTGGAVKRDVTILKFRASVVRDGRHAFNSMDASPMIGGAVLIANPGWTVDLKEYDVEVVTFILERGVAVGLSLGGDRTKRCSHGRIPKEDKGFIESGKRMSSLRPSTAYLMLSLAKPRAGDVVVDCMCGVGTLPFLGAGWFPDVFWVGGEVEEDAVEHVRGNLRSLRRSLESPKSGGEGVAQVAAGAGACIWDAQSLPLRDGTVDVMVVDMPFGYSCGTPRANEKLYPAALVEMARVLRPGTGRAVLLVTQPYLLGLPDIPKARRKEKGLAKKRCRETGLQCWGKGDDEQHPSKDCEDGAGDKANAEQDAERASYDHVTHENHSEISCEVPSGHDARFRTSENSHDSVALKRQAVWRVRDQHSVNVGGLLSSLLVLDRTDEAAPAQSENRRKKWVGSGACRHHTQEQNRQNKVDPVPLPSRV